MEDPYLIVKDYLDKHQSLLTHDQIRKIHLEVSKILQRKLPSNEEKIKKIKSYLTLITIEVNQSKKLGTQTTSTNKKFYSFILIKKGVNILKNILKPDTKSQTFYYPLFFGILFGVINAYVFYHYDIFPSISRITIDFLNIYLSGNAILGFSLGFIFAFLLTKNMKLINTLHTKKILPLLTLGFMLGCLTGIIAGYLIGRQSINRYKIYNGKYKIDTVTGKTWLLEDKNSSREIRERRPKERPLTRPQTRPLTRPRR